MNIHSSQKCRGYLTWVCMCLLIIGCTEPDAGYFPLQEGISWHYHIQATSMTGTEQQKYVVSTLAPRVIDKEKTYIQSSLTGIQLLFRQNDAGTSRIGFLVPDGPSFKKISDDHLLLPLDPQVGAEWNDVVLTQTLSQGMSSEADNMAFRVKVPVHNKIESMTDVVKVPAGRFPACVRVHANGFAFHSGIRNIGRVLVEIDQTKWYAPGVGLVKSRLVETTSSDALSRGELIMELESFTKS